MLNTSARFAKARSCVDHGTGTGGAARIARPCRKVADCLAPIKHHQRLARRHIRLPAQRRVRDGQHATIIRRTELDVQVQRFNADGTSASASTAFDYAVTRGW